MPAGKFNTSLIIKPARARHEYKAVNGSFDSSYFTDSITGKFKFPDYTRNWKGMVKLKDVTNYRSYLHTKTKRANEEFTLEDFEVYFQRPCFEIESFSRFILRFPGESFNKGISKKQLLFMFTRFSDFLMDEEAMDTDVYYLAPKDAREGIATGLLTVIDISRDAAKHWIRLPARQLKEICAAYSIKPANNKKDMAARLVACRADYPLAVVYPSALLKDTYLSCIDLYIQDIKDHIDHFHPFYFTYVWDQVRKCAEERGVQKRAAKILEEAYWADRLHGHNHTHQ